MKLSLYSVHSWQLSAMCCLLMLMADLPATSCDVTADNELPSAGSPQRDETDIADEMWGASPEGVTHSAEMPQVRHKNEISDTDRNRDEANGAACNYDLETSSRLRTFPTTPSDKLSRPFNGRAVPRATRFVYIGQSNNSNSKQPFLSLSPEPFSSPSGEPQTGSVVSTAPQPSRLTTRIRDADRDIASQDTLLGSQEAALYVIPAEDCHDEHVILNVTHTNATIYVMNLKDQTGRSLEGHSLVECIFSLRVPEGFYMRVTIDDLPDMPCDDAMVQVLKSLQTASGQDYQNYRECFLGKNNLIYPRTNEVFVRFLPFKHGTPDRPWLVVHLEATSNPLYHILPLVCASPASGYVMSSDFRQTPYAAGMNASLMLYIPVQHVMYVSFPLLEIGRYPTPVCRGGDGDSLYVNEHVRFELSERVRLPNKCECKVVLVKVYKGLVRVVFISDIWDTNLGFRMYFSFLAHVPGIPMIKSDDRYDCTGPHFTNISQHVRCNLETECLGGEDEKDCPFSHPPCNGSVGYKDRCYKLVTLSRTVTWTEADSMCRTLGGRLATLKTPGEREAVRNFFIYGKRRWFFYVGARTFRRETPANLTQYRYIWKWVDDTVAYDLNISFFSNGAIASQDGSTPDCAFINPNNPHTLYGWFCNEAKLYYKLQYLFQSFICEYENDEKLAEDKVELMEITTPFPQSMTRCLDGHMTRDFLSCDTDSHCGTAPSLKTCRVPGSGEMPKYVCEDEMDSVPYTLVCDYRRDCQDGSDERFCVHIDCLDRTCRNKQCATAEQWCDGMSHCADRSDETGCGEQRTDTDSILDSPLRPPPPVLIDLDGRGRYKQTRLNASQSCPETHFRCPGEYTYCLPVYVRCNGVYDCPNHEDEAECDLYTCPGFYRCRASPLCVHPNHVCDGIFHCPKQDDEWMCGRHVTCPDGCRCQGLAFACTKPFPPDLHPDLRYLDASGSGMTPDDLTSLFYLVELVLSSCGLVTITDMTFPNLLVLDLSDNNITSVNIDIFVGLENLRSLILAGNPLLSITESPASRKVLHPSLRHMDLSRSHIERFDSTVLSSFRKVSTLNISDSMIKTIGTNAFRYLPNLAVLDMHGSSVEQFPADVFTDLQYLTSVWTDNYKLCCKETLPPNFDVRGCVAPVDEISSCEDLLRSHVYRACLWVFAALSVFGNASCFFVRLLKRKNTSKTGFSVFVTNLSVADLLMGVYLVMIGIADLVYRGQYLWFESTWKRSVACEMAGFLSLLSSEMSALLICLITLDRFIVLRFPFSTLYFRRWSAMVTCGVVWTVCITLAAVPLLPAVSHWEFYRQSGICIPLPITRRSFQGRDYSFGVMIVLNFVLFLLVAAGQFFIYWSVRSNVMASERNRKSQDMTIARRLITVAVSDFLCWFPIGLLGLLASRGTPISGEVNVGMAIFVLPLNSALNPFLYTFNMLMEKRRKDQEKDMLSWFEANILTRKRDMESSSLPSSTQVENALKYVKARLDDNTLQYTDVVAHLQAVSRECLQNSVPLNPRQ